MGTKLAIKNLYKIFGGPAEETIRRVEQGQTKDEIFAETGATVGVANANFEINESEIFVVMGLSGSGKSTLVRMLNRLIEPTSGQVILNGKDITKMDRKELVATRRRQISMVFQSFALLPHQTVLQNTAFGLSTAGVNKEEQRKRAIEALDAVGLKAHVDSYPDELSGGMQQRVGLARALAVNPDVLLMDEAYSALDPLIRTEMQDELLHLQSKQARTVVFITHDLDEAMRVGDRIAIMESGRVVQVGTPEEIVMNPANDYVRSFFRNVDVSQVFSAGDVAHKRAVTVIERAGVKLRAALNRLEDYSEDYAVVHGKDGQYMGMVTTDSIIHSIKLEEAGTPQNIEDAFIKAVKPVTSDTPLTDMMSYVAEAPLPVPVKDAETGRYLGTISKAALIKTLNRDDDAVEAA